MFYRLVSRVLTIAALLIIGFGVPVLAYSPYRPLVTTPTTISYGADVANSQVINKKLETGINDTLAKRGCVLLLDANSGQILVSTSITKATDTYVAEDMITQSAWEPGSVMKTLLLASAINDKSIDPHNTIYQNDLTYADDYLITNSHEYTQQSFTVEEMISQSINTAAVKTLQSMSSNNQIDRQSRQKWYAYLTERYRFGAPTGIDKHPESAGFVASATSGTNLNLRYGHMAIGQGITVTPLQLASAYAAIINGGTYYRPLLSDTGNSRHVLLKGVVSDSTSHHMRGLLGKAVAYDFPELQQKRVFLGAKSGTAHSADSAGAYIAGKDTGTYIGFIERMSKTYILLVRLDEPQTESIASMEAGKIWVDIVRSTVDKF